LVPISAQYAPGGDVVYYGDHGHSAFVSNAEVAGVLADDILRYIFGDSIRISIPGYDQGVEHHAGWFPFTYRWDDLIGETGRTSGNISHTNPSFFKWQEWEDIIDYAPNNSRSSFTTSRISIPFLTAVKEVRWWNSDDPNDSRLYIKTRAAPRTTVRVEWNVLQYVSLPPDVSRDHYEIEVTGGVALAEIRRAFWLSDNVSDPRVQIGSQAEGPFHWFTCNVKVFFQREQQRKLIDGFSVQKSAVADP